MKKNSFIFLLILFLCIVLRVYKLYDVPQGIHIDEAGMFVDAISLAETGMDRHGVRFPIYLENFGQGQSIMYAYLLIPFIKIFGNSIILIRIPSLFFGVLTVIFGYFIAKEVYDEKKSLLFMFLLAICPYFIQSSRIGLDCNLFLSFLVIGLFFYIRAIKNSNNCLFCLSGFIFGLSLYTYALSYIVIPVFMLCSLFFLLKNRFISFKNVFVVLIPILILAIPLLLFLLVNFGFMDEFSFIIFSIKRISIFRTSELGIMNVLDNLFAILELLSYDFYDYNALKLFGTVYYSLIPFFVYGLIVLIKHRENIVDKLVFLLFICCYFCLLFIQDININKSNYIFFSIIYIVFVGFINFSFKKVKYIVLIVSFLLFVFVYYGNDRLDRFYFDNELFLMVGENYDMLKNKKVSIISSNNQPKIYFDLGLRLINSNGKIIFDDVKYDICISDDEKSCKDDMNLLKKYSRYSIYYKKK